MQDNDMISRAALIRDIKQHVPTPNTRELYEVNLCIINAPAIDAAPVVHGWWVDENPSDYMDVHMRCSACGKIDTPLANWDYCPHCGAQMDGERK